MEALRRSARDGRRVEVDGWMSDHLAVLAAYSAVVRPTSILALGGAGGFSARGSGGWRRKQGRSVSAAGRRTIPGRPNCDSFTRCCGRRGKDSALLRSLETSEGQTYVSLGGHL